MTRARVRADTDVTAFTLPATLTATGTIEATAVSTVIALLELAAVTRVTTIADARS
jgi:hypothetical protein